jgi:hypothetical protein
MGDLRPIIGSQPLLTSANGQTVGSVSLYLAAGATGVVQFTGTISSQSGASQGTSMDAQLSALETIASGTFTIPLLPNAQPPSATLSVETAASSACTVGTDSASYAMTLPSGGPFLGAYSANGVTMSQSSLQANYVLNGLAFVPSSEELQIARPRNRRRNPTYRRQREDHRGLKPCVCAVSITLGPTPLRHGHQVYVSGNVWGACCDIYRGIGDSWDVSLALRGRVQC